MTALALAALSALFSFVQFSSAAHAEERSLYLYYTHTKETARITFKRNGRYDSKGLAQLNTFLRDWRRNEPTKMDPKLFDLVWEVYQKVGATGPVYVVSAYRAPQTNEMLRSRSRGVAKNSRHTMGMAMDFYIPGVPLKKLRETAMRLQIGGVGYYPTSGSPFVHLDTGNVRAWPRMTRTQLASLFPQGKTLHVPSDGKVLSTAGYSFAKAQWQKCHEVPCGGNIFSNTRIASASAPSPASNSGRTLLDAIFGNGNKDDARSAQPSSPAPAIAVALAPVPLPLPKDLRAPADGAQTLTAPVPAPLPAALDAQSATVQLASAEIAPVPAPARPDTVQTGNDGAPAPRVLLTPKAPQSKADAPVLTAYAPEAATTLDAQRAVQTLVERRRKDQAKTPAPAPSFNTRDLRPATASVSPELNGFAALFQGLRGKPERPQTAARARPPQPVSLHAPDFDHIVEIFLDTASLESARYAVIFDAPEADLTRRADLGAYAGSLKFGNRPEGGLGVGRFVRTGTMLAAPPRS